MSTRQFRLVPGLLGLFCLSLAAASPVRAATWTLANGDRLTGELVEEGPEVIEIRHAQLGVVTLPRKALQPAAPAAAAGTPASASTPADLAPAVAKLPPPPAAKPRWKRQIDVGFSQQSGTKSRQDLNVRGQVDGRLGKDTYRATARLLQSESENKTVTDRNEADFRWRHDLSKRLFAQTQTTYASDDVRKVPLSLEQQVGGGYRVVDAQRHQANVGLGAVVQYLEREGYEDARGVLASVFQDYTYTMSSRLKLTQESSVTVSDSSTFGLQTVRPGLPGATSDGTYRMKFNAALQSRVTPEISFNVRYEYDYDRSVAEAGLRADQRVTTSLGYIW